MPRLATSGQDHGFLVHSYLSATTGSTRAARRAGQTLAVTATKIRSALTVLSATGSVGAVRTRNRSSHRPTRIAPARPTTARSPTARRAFHEEPDHLRRPGTGRHANADLLRALGDAVRRHGVPANRGEQQRDAGHE